MSFDPYLMYARNCGEAFTRYQQIFGGELFVMRMGDAPGNEQVPADQADLVIHAALTIDGRVLMGSDDPTGGTTGTAERVHVYHQAADIPTAEKVYAALAEGGEEVQPLMETFFSPKWGMCTDKFGIRWMIGVPGPRPASSRPAGRSSRPCRCRPGGARRRRDLLRRLEVGEPLAHRTR